MSFVTSGFFSATILLRGKGREYSLRILTNFTAINYILIFHLNFHLYFAVFVFFSLYFLSNISLLLFSEGIIFRGTGREYPVTDFHYFYNISLFHTYFPLLCPVSLCSVFGKDSVYWEVNRELTYRVSINIAQFLFSNYIFLFFLCSSVLFLFVLFQAGILFRGTGTEYSLMASIDLWSLVSATHSRRA